ncbi:MAG: efflux RND transporter periplasmic adaptor subunit [Armatimonadetes bacterium]|nr:efflux RND transporter periplasmic adaptor subunit [Armatimonadota bacterium]
MLRHPHSGLIGLKVILPFLGIFCLVLSVVVITGCAKQSSEATAGRRDITAYLPAQGTVVAPASARANVDSPYEVPVGKVYVTVGKNVSRGETLIVFSAPQNQAYYDQARAALIQAQKALDQTRRHYGRELRAAQKQLALSRSTERKARVTASPKADDEASTSYPPDTSVSSANRQADEQAVIDAQARMAEGLVAYQQAVAAAQEQFAAAQAGGKSAQVKSPITGTVLAVNVGVGTVPNPRDKKPLVTVVNLEALKVAAGVAEDRLSLLRPKNPALVTVKEVPNVEFPGSLDEIYSEKAGFLRGQKYVALVDFKNTKGLAKPGMDATVSIKIGEVHDVLAVPANTVYQVDKQYAVKLREGNQWRQRIVEIGLSDGKYTHIKSGLKEGDVVMTNP